jgi:hypothetical protein
MDNGLPLVVANAGRPEYVNNSRVLGPHPQGPRTGPAREQVPGALGVHTLPSGGRGAHPGPPGSPRATRSSLMYVAM